MQPETAKTRLPILELASLGFLLLFTNNAAAQQSIEDNIRSVGQVCLAGQSCVGSMAGSKPAVAEPETVAPAEIIVAEEAVQEVVEMAEVATEAPAFDVESTYQMSCFACHGTGAAGAPALGDVEAWSERTAKGMDVVMGNVMNGINAMPAKGLCMTCSDDDLRALVDYMAAQ